MPYCSKCGSPVEGRFCTKCGAPVAGDPSEQPGAASTPSRAATPDLAPNVVSALCYVPGIILAVIFLFWSPYNKDRTIRFHAFQSIFLQLCWIVALVVLSPVLASIAAPVWFALERLINLGFILLIAYMIWKTYQKEEVVLPYIGPLAQKQA